MRLLFLLGQCIRLFHTDPWQSDTLTIVQVGNYSYETEVNVVNHDSGKHIGEWATIKFVDQAEYEVVDCGLTN